MAKRRLEIVLDDNLPKVSLMDIVGPEDRWITRIEKVFSVSIECHADRFIISTPDIKNGKLAKAVLLDLIFSIADGIGISEGHMEKMISVALNKEHKFGTLSQVNIRGYDVKIASQEQQSYWNGLNNQTINICDAPAGTGKTFLAIAQALRDLDEGKVDKIIIARPAVETGKSIGATPGDETQKMFPWARPVLDNLSYFIPDSKIVDKLIEEGTLEFNHIGFMRGRSLRNTFFIVDEAQNTTVEEAKMAITRIGEGSKISFGGDTTQCDLPKGEPSGLKYIMNVFANKNLEHIRTHRMTEKSCLRHPAVKEALDCFNELL